MKSLRISCQLFLYHTTLNAMGGTHNNLDFGAQLEGYQRIQGGSRYR